jgi:hypothetical protein
MRVISIREAADRGFIFPGGRKWIFKDNIPALAQDAALITTPNTVIPAEFTSYVDATIINILTAPRMARELFSEVKKGDWTTSSAVFRVNELTGRTSPYTDYGPAGVADVNYNWLERQQYLFQTHIHYGDFEQAISSAAKINLAADKQRAAANVIDLDANKFYLRGVLGREIYGFLNEPNLPAAITAAPVGTGNSPLWSDKTTSQRYEDILALFSQLTSQSRGWVTKDSDLVLAMSPELAVMLGGANEFNISVQDMLNKYFRALKVVTIPELTSESGQKMYLYPREVMGQKTGELAFSEKMRAGRVIPQLSSFEQKFTSTTYGCLIYMPFAFASMTGM